MTGRSDRSGWIPSTYESKLRVGIIVPARNEGMTIGDVLRRIRIAQPFAAIAVIDDFSDDSTATRAGEEGAEVFRMPCHMGYAEVVATGLAWAARQGLETIVLIDADGQHDPADIPALLRKQGDSEADVVIGSRFVGGSRDDRPFLFKLGNQLFSRIIELLTGCRIHDTSSGFKAIRSSVLPSLLRSHFVDFHAESIVFVLAAGFRVVEEPVNMQDRTAGRSMHGLRTMVMYPFKTALMTGLGLAEGRRFRRIGA